MLEKFGQNDPHISNNLYGKPSNIYYKSIVKLTKSSINLTMNRYAQSIVKLAVIFSLFTTFLANPISYVVIFTCFFFSKIYLRSGKFHYTFDKSNMAFCLIGEFNIVVM